MQEFGIEFLRIIMESISFWSTEFPNNKVFKETFLVLKDMGKEFPKEFIYYSTKGDQEIIENTPINILDIHKEFCNFFLIYLIIFNHHKFLLKMIFEL